MIFDVSPSLASAKIASLQSEFPDAVIQAMKVDITDETAVSLAVEKTVEILGSVDILLCFAGVVGCYHALEMTGSQFRKTIDVNTTGNFLVAQATAREMVKQGRRGSITFVASISGHSEYFFSRNLLVLAVISTSSGCLNKLHFSYKDSAPNVYVKKKNTNFCSGQLSTTPSCL
jgi:NAD(P)-dependent dehydrogenase (short-subunit alcohol dehydrogenase family)